VVLNVIRLLKNIRHVDAKSVRNLDDIDLSLHHHKEILKKYEESHPDRIKQDMQENIHIGGNFTDNLDNFEEFKKQVLLFEYVSSGLDEKIIDIVKIIKSDPRIGKYKKEDLYINKKNHEGFTALYIACLNGHIKIVEVLLEYDANHLEYCGVLFFNSE
jgi:ankyrin repeat protein